MEDALQEIQEQMGKTLVYLASLGLTDIAAKVRGAKDDLIEYQLKQEMIAIANERT